MEFEWDPHKEVSNIVKHGINFHEAASIFGDPLSVTFFDPDHSIEEQRFITFGETRFGDLLIVSHTDRLNKIRIISARKMTRQERKIYETG